MDLNDISVSARSLLGGAEGFEATAGQAVKIKTSPHGLDVLNEEVPEGERWQIAVNIQIEKFSV